MVYAGEALSKVVAQPTTILVGKSRIASADAFRALAIFMVVFYHVLQMAQPTWHGKSHVFAEIGVWGVDCFFVLSGFLLGGEYVRRLLSPTIALQSTRIFWLKRVLRIVPLYVACVLLSAVLDGSLLRAFPSVTNILAHLFFVHDFSNVFSTTLNGPYWTMPVDMEFYLLLPFYAAGMAFLFRRFPSTPRIPAIFASLAVIAVLGLVYRYVMARYNPASLHSFADEIVWIRNVAGLSSAFCVGIALSLLSTMKYRPKPIVSALFLAIALVLEVVVMRTSSLEGGPVTSRLVLGQTIFDFAGALSVGLVMYVVIRNDYAFLNRIFGSPIVIELATLAYGVYLIHFPLVDAVAPYFKNGNNIARVVGIGVAAIVPTLILAFILNRLVEQRFLNMKSRVRA